MLLRSLSLLFVTTLLLPLPSAWAQEGIPPDTTDRPVRITLRDGSDVVGTVEREDEENLYFRTASGVDMTIPKEQVRSVEPLSGRIVDGAYLRVDPNRTRLLFAPTARPLRSGQGYFADYYIFFPFVAVGVADVVSLAGGVSLIPGSSGQLVYLAPKATLFQRGPVAVAAGVLAATFTGSDGGYGGLVYGIGTLGPSHKSVTLGLGFAFSKEEFSNSPALVLGGEYQLSNNIKLLTENYLLPAESDGILVSGGIRFFGDNLAADLGLLTAPLLLEESDGFPFIPLVSFAYNFGR